MNEYEEHAKKILKKRFIADVLEGEVRLFIKTKDGYEIKIATLNDFAPVA